MVSNTESNDLHEKRDIELRILSAARAGDFALDRVLGNGDNGVVISAKCNRRGLPFPNKLYAVKILFNDTGLRTKDIRDAYENEWEILSRIRTHPMIIRYWSQFVDVMPDVIAKQSKMPIPNMQSQFVIMDYHSNNFGRKRSTLPTPLPVDKGMKYCIQLADGLVFLKSQGVLHLDLKPDNLLISDNDDIIICDFGCAQQFDSDSMRIELMRGQPPGGNPAHLCPEVLNEFFRVQRGGAGPATVSYFRQTEWAYGCLVHEVIRNVHPFPEYPVKYGRPIQYYDRQIPSLPQNYPQEFQFVVRQLLSYEPATRPSIKDTFNILTQCHKHEGDYNVEALKSKLSLLTERCQSAERERKDARRERDESVKQLQELMSELNTIRNEKEAVNKSLDRIKMEHELATKNVSLLRIENERDKRELTALRRERDVAQTLINQLRASHENPELFKSSKNDRDELVKKWNGHTGDLGHSFSKGAYSQKMNKYNPPIESAKSTPGPSGHTPVPSSPAPLTAPGSTVEPEKFDSAMHTPGGRPRKRWGKAEVPDNLSSQQAGPAIEPLFPPTTPRTEPLFPPNTPPTDIKNSTKPVTPLRGASGGVLQKCRRCCESFRENENHVGACRWHPGKVTVIDWGWMKVNSWDCCGATEHIERGDGAKPCDVEEVLGCEFTHHLAEIDSATNSIEPEDYHTTPESMPPQSPASCNKVTIEVTPSQDTPKPWQKNKSNKGKEKKSKSEPSSTPAPPEDPRPSSLSTTATCVADRLSVTTFVIDEVKNEKPSRSCSVM